MWRIFRIARSSAAPLDAAAQSALEAQVDAFARAVSGPPAQGWQSIRASASLTPDSVELWLKIPSPADQQQMESRWDRTLAQYGLAAQVVKARN